MKEIEKQEFNFNDAVQDLLAGKNINGKDGVLAPLVKQLVEAALEAELDSHITQDSSIVYVFLVTLVLSTHSI